jgi:hypothetical protein
VRGAVLAFSRYGSRGGAYSGLEDARGVGSRGVHDALDVLEHLFLHRFSMSSRLVTLSTGQGRTVCASIPPSTTFIVSGFNGILPDA